MPLEELREVMSVREANKLLASNEQLPLYEVWKCINQHVIDNKIVYVFGFYVDYLLKKSTTTK